MNSCWRILFLYFFLFNSLIFVISQQQSLPLRNTVFAEFGGNGLYYSVNYDYLLRIRSKVKNSIRAGLHAGQLNEHTYRMVLVSEYSWLFSVKKNNFFEAATGLSYKLVSRPRLQLLIPVVRIGYRYQPVSEGLFFKTGITPLLPAILFDYPAGQTVGRFQWMAGVAIGYTFLSPACSDCP